MSAFDSLGKKAVNKAKSKASSLTGGATDGELKKVTITGYQKETYAESEKIGAYTSFLNPNSINNILSLQLKPQITPNNKENTAPPAVTPNDQKLSFDLILDATGATGRELDIKADIDYFKNITYRNIGSASQPDRPYVKVVWGDSINFQGRLESLSISYTLFKSDGSPLRAKLSVSFSGKDPSDDAMVKGNSSNHTSEKESKVGDTLSNICNSVYNSPAAYMAVAKANKLPNVRSLVPGSKLILPPKKN